MNEELERETDLELLETITRDIAKCKEMIKRGTACIEELKFLELEAEFYKKKLGIE